MLLEQYEIQIYFYTLTCLYCCFLWDSLSQHAYPFYSLAADPDRKAKIHQQYMMDYGLKHILVLLKTVFYHVPSQLDNLADY
jgi:hypothetical protein